MSRKKLNEVAIRRLMTLANIESLSDTFVSNSGFLRENELRREDDDLEESADNIYDGQTDHKFTSLKEDDGEVNEDEDTVNEMGMPQAYNAEEDVPVDMPTSDEIPYEEEPVGGASGDVDVMALVTAITDAISAQTGVDISTEGGAAAAVSPEEIPSEEPPADMPAEIPTQPEEEDEYDTPPMSEAKEDDPAAIPTVDEDMANKIASLVTERIMTKFAALNKKEEPNKK